MSHKHEIYRIKKGTRYTQRKICRIEIIHREFHFKKPLNQNPEIMEEKFLRGFKEALEIEDKENKHG